MTRTIRLLLLLVLMALAAAVVVRLRATRAPEAGLGGSTPLPGSFDTWPEVPVKQVA